MKKLYKQLIIIACIFFTHIAMASFGVSELYIEAQGNNKYEAQIKAHNQGMQRAFLMVADTLGIRYNSLLAVPYLKLKDVFSIAAAKKVTETDNSYQATVTYQYNLYPLHQLLFEYGDDSVKDKFYEYLILPISKQRNILTLWNQDQEWNKQWSRHRNILDQAKLFYPKPSADLMKKINADNVLSLSFESFLDIFPSILYKKIMLVVCEYFTNINTGAAMMNIKYIVIDNNGKTASSQEYPLNDLKEVALTIDKILKIIPNKFGRLTTTTSQDMASDESTKPVILPKKVVEDDVRTIVLDLEAFTEEELTRVKNKLQNVKDIEDFAISHNYDEKYKVIIHTKSDDYKLAEGFYLNGLSFKMYGNLYSLINVIKGGG